GLRRPRLPRAGAGRGDADPRPARGDRPRRAGRLRALLLPREDRRPARALSALSAGAAARSDSPALRARHPRRARRDGHPRRPPSAGTLAADPVGVLRGAPLPRARGRADRPPDRPRTPLLLWPPPP